VQTAVAVVAPLLAELWVSQPCGPVAPVGPLGPVNPFSWKLPEEIVPEPPIASQPVGQVATTTAFPEPVAVTYWI
jgi:hypothetical protein